MTPRQVGRVARRVILLGVALCFAYAAWRYELATLPDGARPPLLGIAGGDRLLFDRRFGELRAGDAVLVEHDGALLLARIAEPPPPEARADWPEAWHARLAEPGALWLAIDRDDHPGPSSAEIGPVARDAVRARLVIAL